MGKTPLSFNSNGLPFASFVDHNKAMNLCVAAHHLYSANKVKTKVLPASLTSTDEIMALAGVDHITISPGLLQQLVETPASEETKASLFDGEIDIPPMLSFTNEPEYRIAFTLSGKGEGERKLTQVSVRVMVGEFWLIDYLGYQYLLRDAD
jgi:transaldolase